MMNGNKCCHDLYNLEYRGIVYIYQGNTQHIYINDSSIPEDEKKNTFPYRKFVCPDCGMIEYRIKRIK